MITLVKKTTIILAAIVCLTTPATLTTARAFAVETGLYGNKGCNFSLGGCLTRNIREATLVAGIYLNPDRLRHLIDHHMTGIVDHEPIQIIVDAAAEARRDPRKHDCLREKRWFWHYKKLRHRRVKICR